MFKSRYQTNAGVYPPTQLIGPSAIELMAKGGPEVL